MSRNAKRSPPSRQSPTRNDNEGELLDIVRHQTEYIDQLEKENGFLNGKLASFKQRLENVVRENQIIHDDMRADVVNNTIQKASLYVSDNAQSLLEEKELEFSKRQSAVFGESASDEDSNQQRLNQWMQEMKNMKAIYEAKIKGFDAEAKLMKQDLRNALEDAEELRKRNRKMEAMLKEPNRNEINPKDITKQLEVNVPLIERLTKERDDLMKSITSMRSSFLNAQKQETGLRQEIQKSLTLVEDLQLEKAQLKISKDRIQKDLALTRQRLEAEISSSQQRLAEAAMHQRNACKEEMNELLKKVGELSATISTYENQLESAGRDKMALTVQLEQARRELMIVNEDLGRMRSEVERDVKSTIRGYRDAEAELRDTKSKLQEEILKTNQERVRLEHEAADNRKHLSSAQTEALASNELNVTLTTQLNDALHRLQDCRQEKDKILKEYQDETEKCVAEWAEKEERLQHNARRLETEYEGRLTDLEKISTKQSNLIKKLRDEGRVMETMLRKMSKKYRKEVGTLCQDKEQVTARLSRLLVANQELEKQVVHHGKTHRQTKEMVKELDERACKSTIHAAMMMEKLDQVTQEKHFLQKEIDFLQIQAGMST